MNKKLQDRLTSIEQLIALQKETVDETGGTARDYMHGMANGMILVHAIILGDNPKFVIKRRQNHNNRIRHKLSKAKHRKR